MNNKLTTHRVVTFLTREELEFVDKLERDMMFSVGTHISRSKIIENLVDLLAETRMNASGIKNNQEFVDKIKEAILKMAQEQCLKKEEEGK